MCCTDETFCTWLKLSLQHIIMYPNFYPWPTSLECDGQSGNTVTPSRLMVTKRLPLEILLGIKMCLAKHEICIVLVHPAWCVRYSIFIRRKRWLFDMIMKLSNTKSRKISPKLPSSTCMSVFYSSLAPNWKNPWSIFLFEISCIDYP